MPKVKLGYRPNYEAVSKNIKKYIVEKGIKRVDVANSSFIKYSTFCYKLANPQKLYIEELSYIAKTLNVSVEALIKGL